MSTSRVGRGLDGVGGEGRGGWGAVWPLLLRRNSTASANPACTGQHRFGPGETLQREGDPLALPPSGRLQPVAGYLEPDRGNTSTHATKARWGGPTGARWLECKALLSPRVSRCLPVQQLVRSGC